MAYSTLAECHDDINQKFADNTQRLILEGTARQVLNDMADFLHDTFSLIDITYQDFYNSMVQDPETPYTPLIPGRIYRIVDNRTCHLIWEITPAGGLNYTGEEQLGPVEPLIVLATSETSYLQDYVFSQPTGHRLSWKYNGGMLGYETGSVYTGIITRRTIEGKNISIPYDFQSVIWKMNGQYFSTFNSPFSDPGNPDYLEDRTYSSSNVVIKSNIYDNFRPTIFTIPEVSIVNIEIGIVDMFVIRYCKNLRLDEITCTNVNFNMFDVQGNKLSTAPVIVPSSPYNLSNCSINNRITISNNIDGDRWSNCIIVNNDTFDGTMAGIRIIGGELVLLNETS